MEPARRKQNRHKTNTAAHAAPWWRDNSSKKLGTPVRGASQPPSNPRTRVQQQRDGGNHKLKERYQGKQETHGAPKSIAEQVRYLRHTHTRTTHTQHTSHDRKRWGCCLQMRGVIRRTAQQHSASRTVNASSRSQQGTTTKAKKGRSAAAMSMGTHAPMPYSKPPRTRPSKGVLSMNRLSTASATTHLSTPTHSHGVSMVGIKR